MSDFITQLPTIGEVFLNPVSYIIYLIYGILMVWELMFPAQKLPQIPYWKLKGIIAFATFFLLASYLPLLWDGLLAKYQLFDLSWLGTIGGSIIGVLVYELGEYVWHRTMHKNEMLWKVSHQMHHSAERLDSYGAFYFSPIDMIGWIALSSICLVLITGFSPEATTVIILVTNFLSIFQHSNVKTPRWLGFFIQRPESHNVHHGKGIHSFNYSGLPIYDLLFGTFKNPKNYENETGFYHGASSRIGDMLLFKNISNNEE